MAVALAVAVAGCTNALESRLPDAAAIDLSAKGKTAVKNRQGNPGAIGKRQGSYELFAGTAVDGGSVGDLSSGAEGVEQSGDKFSINVDGADINEVTKLILGDTLGLNYIVDPRVQGTITLSSIRPMTSKQVLSAFEVALRLNGASLIHQGEVYKVVPLQEVLEGEMGTAERAERGAAATPGYGVTVIPLRFISPNNMLELLDSFIARSGSVRASNVGNMLLVRGSGQERQQLVDVILSFDVDWMKQQTASIAILANSKPAEMAQKLNSIFANDTNVAGSNALKIVPLERLNGVVIIANSREKVRRALTWVGRLDRESDEETGYYVYNVQNGSAVSLAKILNATFLEKSGEDTVASQVDPNLDQATVSTNQDGSDPNAPDGSGEEDTTDETGDQSAGGKSSRQDLAPIDGSTTASTDMPKTDLSSGIRITPNPETNTIVIRAPPKVYAKMLATLKQLDKQAVQVLVNATIAEVQLNDELTYGVQAYLKEKDIKFGFSSGNGLAIKPNIPGLNFLVGSVVDPRIVLEALDEVTRVKVISSPSVLVLENENAVIKVGDSVPVKVTEQQATNKDDRVVNQIEYRDAGVILKVKPRVSANGIVTMLISQELSSVTGSADGNPTFSQRTVSSTVSVPSSQTVALGGMISGQETRGKSSVPLLNKVPVIGDLIGKTENISKRTELIVFLTPTLIQDGEDAARVAEELRERMRNLGFN